MTPLFVTAAIGVFGGVATLAVAFIPYRKHRFALNDALTTTIKTIEKGRMSLVAVREDFPVHKQLIDNLRRYMIFSKGFKVACSKYTAFYEDMQAEYKTDQILMFLDNSEVTREILGHLNSLKDKV